MNDDDRFCPRSKWLSDHCECGGKLEHEKFDSDKPSRFAVTRCKRCKRKWEEDIGGFGVAV